MSPLVLHFHGGAFTSGGLDDGARMARLLAQAGAVVVSIAYPLLSLGYVLNAIGAHYLLGEALSATRIGGIGLIIVGVWLVMRS